MPAGSPTKKKSAKLNPKTMTKKQKIMLLGIVALVALGVMLPILGNALGQGSQTTSSTIEGTSTVTTIISGTQTFTNTLVIQPVQVISTETITNASASSTTVTVTTTTTTTTVTCPFTGIC